MGPGVWVCSRSSAPGLLPTDGQMGLHWCVAPAAILLLSLAVGRTAADSEALSNELSSAVSGRPTSLTSNSTASPTVSSPNSPPHHNSTLRTPLQTDPLTTTSSRGRPQKRRHKERKPKENSEENVGDGESKAGAATKGLGIDFMFFISRVDFAGIWRNMEQ